MSHDHGREVVAVQGCCAVERCSCGTLHVSVGPVTFRSRPEMIEELWATLGSALARIAAKESGCEVPITSMGRAGGVA